MLAHDTESDLSVYLNADEAGRLAHGILEGRAIHKNVQGYTVISLNARVSDARSGGGARTYQYPELHLFISHDFYSALMETGRAAHESTAGRRIQAYLIETLSPITCAEDMDRVSEVRILLEAAQRADKKLHELRKQ